jgi:putative inorganic carbon (HCO3(-)) transporter
MTHAPLGRSYRHLFLEASVLTALAPCLMLGGYGALIVPIGVAAVWAVMHYWTGRAWPRSDLNWSIGALLVLSGASLVLTRGTVLWAVPKITTLVFGIAWFFALLRWRRAGFTPHSLTWACLAACFGLSVAGAVATNWMPKVWPLSALTSTLPQVSLGVGGLHPNAVAGTLLLLIPLCIPPLVVAWRARQTFRMAAAGAVLLLALTILLLTQSRGGWLGGLASAFVLLLYRVRRLGTRPAIPLIIAFGLGCAAVAFWAAVPRADLAGSDLIEKWAARREMWRLGFLFIGDFPWTGVGFNGFRNLATGLYSSAYETYGMDIAHPHNMWLSVGVDLGIPGIIAYLAIWVVAIRRVLRVASTGGEAQVLICQCLLAAWVGFWTFGIADVIPLGSKLGTALWPVFALSQMLGPSASPQRWSTRPATDRQSR